MKIYRLTKNTAERIRRIVRLWPRVERVTSQVENLTVGPGLQMWRTPNTLAIAATAADPRTQRAESPLRLVMITSNATGSGKYNGKIVTPCQLQLSPTMNLSSDDIGPIPDNEDCYFFNLDEYDSAGSHYLTAGTGTVFGIGMFMGSMVISGVAKPVIYGFAIKTAECE